MSKHIVKAKAALVMDQPFYASLLLGMPIVEDTTGEVETADVDGEQIRYNREWMDKLSLPETIFLLAHETLHCVYHHMTRRGERDADGWNIAADYVINDHLVRDKIGIMPKEGLLNQKLVEDCGGSTEAVYNSLAKNPPNPQSQGDGDGSGDSKGKGKPKDGKGKGKPSKFPKPGQPGGSLDRVKDAGKDEAERAQKESEMRVKIVQAANAARMQGKLSAGLERLVGEMTRSRVDWRAVLRRFITERTKTEWSFAKPKRRFLADDIILPGLTGEKIGCIAVAVDCSGSIDDSILSAFDAEIRAICEDTAPGLVHVLYFDSRVLKTENFGPEDTVKLSPCGGGGTAFSPIWESIEQSGLDPVACVVLTDLVCSDFGDAPHYPVLWASTDADSAPFGEVVRIQAE